ncbi:TetR/AcrR family transcriptional regulator [Streptomonospora sp. S1-112]|uniref:TetR/AcrR family transcriptional regulator n=1 Tax=Streptomonospora mangrovi TaxID=2883123 RepID=A0A9X3SFV4_9ACTN|nr:TetR/AcrR family transcriptional regulator [Streptomonospora mangrovi]MDA0563369.1 TetR/AcrR family transcriptional regulator [Streptomonospora mangrovi]
MAGLRERKKQATRENILRAAFGLFLERGYEATSVTQIAEAAMVSPATFFTYFPTKEDVVFVDLPERVAAFSEALRGRRPGEPVPDLILRAFEEVAATGPLAATGGLLAGRGAVVVASPALRSAAVGRVFEVQRQWGEVLHEAAPELPARRARAVIGAVVGAAVAAAIDEVESGGADVVGAAREAVRTAAIAARPD